MQQYRLFKQIATSIAISMTGQWIAGVVQNSDLSSGDLPDDIVELHATCAGLKGLCTKRVADGIEDLRKCCGGHGYMLAAGVSALAADYVWQTTAEGDFIVMLLQTARYLMRQLTAVSACVCVCVVVLAYSQPIELYGCY